MRGVIQYVERAQQIIDFGGMLYGKITPTDIDGLIEYHDKAYVVFELKYGAKGLPPGQRLCLQRMIDDYAKSGKKAIAIVAEHHVDDPRESIPAAECLVRMLYSSADKPPVWRAPIRPMTVRSLTDAFIGWVDARLDV